MSALDADIQTFLDDCSGLVLWLTGAGISAESGIPTFRGPEGYWRVGSKNYHAQQMATRAAFAHMPDEVWAWYLYRRGVCHGAKPNVAHRALAELEQALGDRFLLVTQNVDGLHVRAGNSLDRTYQIHGNIDFMRCSRECLGAAIELPAELPVEWERGRPLGDEERALLRCPACGAAARPHVLWFDEVYDEPNFRFQSSLAAAAEAELLILVGTTGMTNLPLHMGQIAAQSQTPLIVINLEPNPFSELVERTGRGAFIAGTAGNWVPRLAERLKS